jgi:hypothetical protein
MRNGVNFLRFSASPFQYPSFPTYRFADFTICRPEETIRYSPFTVIFSHGEIRPLRGSYKTAAISEWRLASGL